MENFESKKFEDYMKKQEGMREILGPEDGVFIAKFIDKYGEAIVLRELNSKEEYDDWYERTGRDIEKNHEGKIAVEFGPSELKPVDAEISKKEGFTFIVSGKDDKNDISEKFRVVAEFDTLKEAQDFQDSLGRMITDPGGEVAIGYGLSELNK